MVDKKGQLEVEVIRARGLIQKPGSKSTPGKKSSIQPKFRGTLGPHFTDCAYSCEELCPKIWMEHSSTAQNIQGYLSDGAPRVKMVAANAQLTTHSPFVWASITRMWPPCQPFEQVPCIAILGMMDLIPKHHSSYNYCCKNNQRSYERTYKVRGLYLILLTLRE